VADGASGILLRPGTLRWSLARASRAALERGALQPIATEQRFVTDGGVRFLVRIVSSLARKDEEWRLRPDAATRPGMALDPFLPPDPDLFVAEVSDTHVAVLNRFNVIDQHLLLVTRAFEDQEALLGIRDFAALWACMGEYDSLGFYNGGAVAGASERHKHLQLVPLPLAGEGPALPVGPLLDQAPQGGEPGRVPGLPFAHAFCRLPPEILAEGAEAAPTLERLYRSLLRTSGLGRDEASEEGRQPGPYNLLMTRRWMLLVPRSQERFQGISVNALGFAGSLFVRNPEQAVTVSRAGPMAVLQAVAWPRS
jgi:ATP adenylyltransferase